VSQLVCGRVPRPRPQLARRAPDRGALLEQREQHPEVRAEDPDLALLFRNEDALKLPRRGMGAHTLLATGDSFFVYPTKLREYQSRYRGSFLHGGVTPEECILPVSLLTPKR